MSVSVYNETLKQKAKELKQFAEGEIQEVDLSGFKEISEQRAATLGKTARKNWRDSAVVTEEGYIVNPNNSPAINAHTIAVGKVLHALGYRGPFFITKDLKLTKEKQTAKKEVVTIEEIIKAAIE
jgi:hypothetical protein